MQIVEGHLLIEISPIDADRITYQNLIECRDRLKKELKMERPKVFHVNPKKDKKVIKEHVRAFNKVIKYFKEPR